MDTTTWVRIISGALALVLIFNLIQRRRRRLD
jgi:hypothetical protein